MNSKFKVSVIIPAYKAELTLPLAVKSLMMQTYPNWEAIIVSDDLFDYKDLLLSLGFSDERLLFASTNEIGSGASNARNIGKDISSGDFISPLDADDEYDPERIEILLPMAIKYGVSCSNVELIDENGEFISKAFQSKKEKIHTIDDYFDTDIPIPYLMSINNCNHQWGSESRAEDTIFNLIALSKSPIAGYSDKPLYKYRNNPLSLCNQEGVGELFNQSYLSIIENIRRNSYRFIDSSFSKKAEDLFLLKKEINESFEKALELGFSGSFQEYSDTERKKYNQIKNSVFINKNSYQDLNIIDY